MFLVLAFALIAAPCWTPPVDAVVVDPYRAPACTYCPGNRGIEYGPRPGQPVVGVAAGTVTFAGSVAGTRYVVIEHADGLRATYGRLASVSVARGDTIRPGTRIGTTTGRFYFGLRRPEPSDEPVDPTPWLGRRRFPTRLVPIDGTPAPWPGPGTLSCRNGTSTR
ncbi:MAG: murein hydrolase activator EnvC [Ilumatobacteraceae bacterium]